MRFHSWWSRPSGRQIPPCPYFDSCGGCPWQQVVYETQTSAKEKNVRDALWRIGRFQGFELLPILPSPEEYAYRRRVRLQIDHRKRVGFHRALTHEVVEIDSCLIADRRLDRVLQSVRKWIQELTMQLHQVELVAGDGDREIVLAVQTREPLPPVDNSPFSNLIDREPGIGGIVLSGPSWRRSWGEVKLQILLEGDMTLQVDADIFLQVNREGNRRIIEEVLDWGEFRPGDRVLELYCGAGNLTLPVAKRTSEVVAVEGDSRAITNGRISAELNTVKNIRWLYGDVRTILNATIENHPRFSRVLLNPPVQGPKDLCLTWLPSRLKRSSISLATLPPWRGIWQF